MAAVPSTFAPRGRVVRRFRGCSIDTDPPLSTKLPIILHISLDPTNNTAIIRLRIEARSSPDPLWLVIEPENIRSLSLHQGSPTCLHFRVTSVSLIMPEDLLPPSLEKVDRMTLESLRVFALRTSVRVFLPEEEEDLSQLTALCEAVDRGGLHSDPGQMQLKTLYRGRGGRVVQLDEEFWPPASFFSSPTSLLDPHSHSTDLPPNTEQSPPEYPNVGSSPRLPSPSTRDRKRLRTRTASSSSISSLDCNTWKHMDLAVGEREKIMAELLHRAESREKKLRNVISVADEKLANLNLLIAKLDVRSPVACKAGGSRMAQTESVQAEAKASQVSTASVASAASPASSTTISSNIPEHVQAYVNEKLKNLRVQLISQFESVEQQVLDEVESRLSGYVTDYEMEAAIEEAIDDAMATIKERVLDTWR